MKPTSSVLRGLFVGVNNYEEPSLGTLKCAVKDATDLATFFNDEAGFSDARVEVAIDASCSKLKRLIGKAISSCNELEGHCDLFLLGFLGSGIDWRGTTYLFPADAEPEHLEESA